MRHTEDPKLVMPPSRRFTILSVQVPGIFTTPADAVCNIEGETKGKALQVDAVYRMLERMEKKTGIHTTPHMLRRYFGNMRRDTGWPLEMISEAYGHKHIDTTIKYLNIIDDQLMEASDQYYAKHSALYDVEKLL